MSGFAGQIASELAAEPTWAGFARFWELRAKGLRKPALEAAQAFATETSGKPFEERLRFCLWLDAHTDPHAGELEAFDYEADQLRPHQLEDLLSSTFAEWRKREPLNADSQYRYAKLHRDTEFRFPGFRSVLELDPGHLAARRALVEGVLRAIGYGQHEIPSGYFGDPREDLALLDEVEPIARALPGPRERERNRNKIDYARAQANAWLERGLS